MHDSAYNNAKEFVSKYVSENSFVLDVGSQDINGSMKPLFSNCNYIGIDMEEGKNVDVVCNSHKMPFDENVFDVIVSSSNFEHDSCFWETFREMCRVVKAGGLIYICAPSKGQYHGYPGDCWRFYKDAGKALQYWINNFTPLKVILVEQNITQEGEWNDNVMVFRKSVASRIDIINYLIKKYKYENYLEIGCAGNLCFDKIVAKNKTGIDPVQGGTLRMTSDEFFAKNENKFDLIFIDGLHVSEQIKRDIENSLKFLNEGGTIVCHDMNPSAKVMQMIPRINDEWTGDGWKVWVDLRMTRKDLSMYVINTDYGVGIIQPGEQEVITIDGELTYERFEQDKLSWMNFVSSDDFLLKE